MMSPKKAVELVRLNPAEDYVVIKELVAAGRILADRLRELEHVRDSLGSQMQEQSERMAALEDQLSEQREQLDMA